MEWSLDFVLSPLPSRIQTQGAPLLSLVEDFEDSEKRLGLNVVQLISGCVRRQCRRQDPGGIASVLLNHQRTLLEQPPPGMRRIYHSLGDQYEMVWNSLIDRTGLYESSTLLSTASTYMSAPPRKPAHSLAGQGPWNQGRNDISSLELKSHLSQHVMARPWNH